MKRILLFILLVVGMCLLTSKFVFAHDLCQGCGYDPIHDGGSEVGVNGGGCPIPLGDYGPCINEGPFPGICFGGGTGQAFRRTHCDSTTHPCSWNSSSTCTTMYTEVWSGVSCTGCGTSGGSCFLPGTQVSTPLGDRNIETIKPGDPVLSFNELTGKTVLNTVSDSPKRTVSQYYIIKTKSGRDIKTTAEHPFYTGTTIDQPSTISPPNLLNYLKVKFISNSH